MLEDIFPFVSFSKICAKSLSVDNDVHALSLNNLLINQLTY